MVAVIMKTNQNLTFNFIKIYKKMKVTTLKALILIINRIIIYILKMVRIKSKYLVQIVWGLIMVYLNKLFIRKTIFKILLQIKCNMWEIEKAKLYKKILINRVTMKM